MVALSVTVHKALILLVFLNHPYQSLAFSGFIETETILIPPVDKVIAFDDYCKSIFNQIFANGKQNEHLAVLRDTLLPKLMSGEIDVSDIQL